MSRNAFEEFWFIFHQPVENFVGKFPLIFGDSGWLEAQTDFAANRVRRGERTPWLGANFASSTRRWYAVFTFEFARYWLAVQPVHYYIANLQPAVTNNHSQVDQVCRQADRLTGRLAGRGCT